MSAEPLPDQLRAEAAEWANDEHARVLMLKAADKIERDTERLEGITAEIDRLLTMKTRELA